MLFNELVIVFDNLSKTSKRLELTEILSNFFKKLKCEEIGFITLLCMGKIFPASEGKELGMASNLMIDAIALASGSEKNEVKKQWNIYGDIGETAKKCMSKKKQVSLIIKELSIKELKEVLYKLPEISGKGSSDLKLKLVSKLLSMTDSLGAMYLTRIMIGSMRTGVGQGVIRDALAKAFNAKPEDVERAYNLCADYSIVASKVCSNPELIINPKIILFSPINMMLFLKAQSVKEAFERVGRPARIEVKYDGMRAQIHKKDNEIQIFTRNLDNVSNQFPDAIQLVKECVTANTIIFECEIVGFSPKTNKPLAFQFLSKRIKRKYEIETAIKEIPIKMFCFDLLLLDDKNYLDEKFIDRHEALKKSINENNNIMLAKGIITKEDSEAEKLFNEGIKEQEGVMFKSLIAPYSPGARVGHGVKLKSHMKELDLVITEAYYGKGRRKDWFGSFTLSCYDTENDKYLTIGKLGTGFSDEQLKEMNELVKKSIISKDDEKVILSPNIVVEVEYEEIQKSPTYSSGYALRFPRLVRIRYDKKPDEASNLFMIDELK
ncbi:MAG: ATP-dependent DNA ligase [Candidatus Nanoarchaeia archaeon]|nr:ATP-dependent DNA ligase [Candidatus Nanoarchaeia archaeon]